MTKPRPHDQPSVIISNDENEEGTEPQAESCVKFLNKPAQPAYSAEMPDGKLPYA